MKQITLSEYNKIGPDFRGVWTTERDDLPDWPQKRHLYMGKRTMMSGDGSCTLLIEGLSFEIIDDPPPKPPFNKSKPCKYCCAEVVWNEDNRRYYNPCCKQLHSETCIASHQPAKERSIATQQNRRDRRTR